MSSSEESDAANVLGFLPQKSKRKYIVAYECFMRWKNKRNEEKSDEGVLLAYFTELAKAQKPSTLWAQYSMLKATMRVKHQVYMQNDTKLLSFLKKCTIGFTSEKSRSLTENEIERFVNEAPDTHYLATKVALIIGVGGACKLFELTDLTVNDIQTHGDLMLVQIQSLQGKYRTFIVRNEFVPTIKKYQALRPKKVPTNRFFVNYRAGQCTRQVIGKNKFATLPKQIASYLKLPSPEKYTGHCFRRSGLAFRTSLMTVHRPRQAIDQEAEILTEDISDVNAENLDNEVDVKVEEIDNFEEVSTLRNNLLRSPVRFYNDFPSTSREPQSSTCDLQSQLSDIGVSEDVSEEIDDTVRINGEEIRTIQLSSLQENHCQSENDKQETEFNVAGNKIKISFKNCAHVGNVTVNVMNK